MAEQLLAKNPAEAIVKFWQAWMSAGLDAMQRTTAAFLSPSGRTAELGDPIEKAVRASFEAARMPSAGDLERIAEELSALRAQVEAIRTGTAALEARVKGQQEVWEALAGSVRHEIRDAMTNWNRQWEDRISSRPRGLEEWRQTSQESAEDLSKTTSDVPQKMLGAKRGARKKSGGG